MPIQDDGKRYGSHRSHQRSIKSFHCRLRSIAIPDGQESSFSSAMASRTSSDTCDAHPGRFKKPFATFVRLETHEFVLGLASRRLA